MIRVAFVALSLLSLVDQSRYREGRGRCGREGCESPLEYAAFEAFPASGAGVAGGACTTTPPTDARGNAVSGARASDGMCTKGVGGLRSTLIANSDLVSLTSNVVRIELDADGVPGALSEGARTNGALRAQEWNPAGTGIGVWNADGTVVVTDNAAVSPDGTTTADLVDDNVAGFEGIYQTITAAAGTYTCAIYQKGGTSTTPLIQMQDQGGGGGLVSLSPTVSTSSWSRTSLSITTTAATTGYRLFFYPAQSGAQGTVYGWQADCQGGAFATSTIPTTSAAATRAADIVSFPVTLSGSDFSAAVSYNTPSVLVTNATAFQVYVDANNSVTGFVSAAGKLTCTFRIGGSDSTVTSTASITANAVNRTACTYGAAGRSACVGGTCTTTAGALTMFTGSATFYGGTRSATGNEASGIISRWCYDPADPRCVL